MTCTETQLALSIPEADRAPDEHTAVTAHVATCYACSRRAADYDALDALLHDELALWAAAVPAPARLADRIRPVRSVRSVRRHRGWIAAALGAAALVLAVFRPDPIEPAPPSIDPSRPPVVVPRNPVATVVAAAPRPLFARRDLHEHLYEDALAYLEREGVRDTSMPGLVRAYFDPALAEREGVRGAIIDVLDDGPDGAPFRVDVFERLAPREREALYVSFRYHPTELVAPSFARMLAAADTADLGLADAAAAMRLPRLLEPIRAHIARTNALAGAQAWSFLRALDRAGAPDAREQLLAAYLAAPDAERLAALVELVPAAERPALRERIAATLPALIADATTATYFGSSESDLVESLSALDDPAAVPLASTLLAAAGGSLDTRIATVEALGWRGKGDAIPAIRRFLERFRADEADAIPPALWALARCGDPDARGELARLTSALTEATAFRWAVVALTDLGLPPRAFLDVLRDRVGNGGTSTDGFRVTMTGLAGEMLPGRADEWRALLRGARDRVGATSALGHALELVAQLGPRPEVLDYIEAAVDGGGAVASYLAVRSFADVAARVVDTNLSADERVRVLPALELFGASPAARFAACRAALDALAPTDPMRSPVEATLVHAIVRLQLAEADHFLIERHRRAQPASRRRVLAAATVVERADRAALLVRLLGLGVVDGADDTARVAVDALGAQDWATREAAERRLAELGLDAVRELAAGARDVDLERSSRCRARLDAWDYDIVAQAVDVIGGGGGPVRSIERALDVPDERVRRVAAFHAVRLAGDAPVGARGLAALRTEVRDGDAPARLCALQLLLRLGRPDAVELLLAALPPATDGACRDVLALGFLEAIAGGPQPSWPRWWEAERGRVEIRLPGTLPANVWADGRLFRRRELR